MRGSTRAVLKRLYNTKNKDNNADIRITEIADDQIQASGQGKQGKLPAYVEPPLTPYMRMREQFEKECILEPMENYIKNQVDAGRAKSCKVFYKELHLAGYITSVDINSDYEPYFLGEIEDWKDQKWVDPVIARGIVLGLINTDGVKQEDKGPVLTQLVRCMKLAQLP